MTAIEPLGDLVADAEVAAAAADFSADMNADGNGAAAAPAASLFPLSRSLSFASSPLPQPSPPPPKSPPLPSFPSLTVQRFAPARHAHLVLYLAALHAACITHDGLSGSFLPPLHHEKLLTWWKVRLAETAVFLLLDDEAEATAAAATATSAITAGAPGRAGSHLVGAAMLRPHPAETSPHVAAVELLLVCPRHRRQQQPRQQQEQKQQQEPWWDARPAGAEAGQILLDCVAAHARAEGRTLLTAETEADSAAAALFLALGFTEAGRIPGFVLRRPGVTGGGGGGAKRDQLLLYKDLLAPPS
ncbi:gcn5-related n-acetyltransferase [Niveomyces insectorum RCEF 264]|uniref:Gcn5-related n-acetyltransferase n=1 Tax=Niveomyces insectorum RCEF 264 TaxID=1081102 RepID=A0A167QY94_9HYPO|nr:gcn5-related n-acetyltransferase [Niveomyces insectorum RCEF 264]